MKHFLLPFLIVSISACSSQEAAVTGASSAPASTEAAQPPAVLADVVPATPQELMRLVIKSAQTGQYHLMSGRCAANANPEVMKICSIVNATPADQKAFTAEFGRAALVGEPDLDGNNAKQGFSYGAGSATMSMVKQDDVWYLVNY